VKRKGKRPRTDHAIVSLNENRRYTKRICAQKGCKFRGKEAQQGVCYSGQGELIDWDRLAEQEAREQAELDRVKKKYKGKTYVEWLEAMYLCAQLNWQGTLDECIRLRRDNALLRLKKKR
jgi:hypothetical protein